MNMVIGFLVFSFLSCAASANPPAAPAPNMTGQFIMLGGFFAIFYFLVLRPQSKRAKSHQQLIAALTIGDEVLTSGGILAKITAVSDHYVTVMVAEGVELKVQKQAVTASMPKGTLKSL